MTRLVETHHVDEVDLIIRDTIARKLMAAEHDHRKQWQRVPRPARFWQSVMSEIKTRHLFNIALKVSPPHVIGSTPYGERRIVPVPEGEFEGERLRGVVLNGGSDWILVRPDHVWALNVRLVLRTNEGDLIEMSYRGLRHGPAHIIEQVHRGEPVDPSAYYFRTAIFFETGSERYAWMNKILAIGSGYREPAGPRYQVFEVL